MNLIKFTEINKYLLINEKVLIEHNFQCYKQNKINSKLINYQFIFQFMKSNGSMWSTTL